MNNTMLATGIALSIVAGAGNAEGLKLDAPVKLGSDVVKGAALGLTGSVPGVEKLGATVGISDIGTAAAALTFDVSRHFTTTLGAVGDSGNSIDPYAGVAVGSPSLAASILANEKQTHYGLTAVFKCLGVTVDKQDGGDASATLNLTMNLDGSNKCSNTDAKAIALSGARAATTFGSDNSSAVMAPEVIVDEEEEDDDKTECEEGGGYYDGTECFTN